jgi:hypothetical protein
MTGKELDMEHEQCWFVGIDWSSQEHRVHVSDAAGAKLGGRSFSHDGAGLAAMAEWILAVSGARPQEIAVAIETPHGPVVESLMERGFRVHAINPKQLDRFRDRFSPAGAKDDSRDAEVLASALRTDPQCLRALDPVDPSVVELREWSRIAEEIGRDRVRLTNRLREQLWRYYPQMIDVAEDLAADWVPSSGSWRRPRRGLGGCASTRSPGCSSTTASAASQPPSCWRACARRRSPWHRALPRPPARISRR